MSTPDNNIKVYRCKICNKTYSSRQNLWKHNNKFHVTTSDKSLNMSDNVTKNEQDYIEKSLKSSDISNDVSDKIYKCNKCNKKFLNRKTKWSHEKKCIVDINDKNKDDEIVEIKKQNVMMAKQIEDMKNMIAELLKTRKIHPKTLQKINNNLTNNINNGTINNNNNTTIIKFGSVNIQSILKPREVMGVLQQPYGSTEECLRLIHFNDKRPEYQNIYITNMKDDLAYIFDGEKFVTATKNDVITRLIENYAEQVEISLEDYRDKLPESKIRCVENYLKLINSEKKYVDEYNKTHANFKTYKIADVKRLIYDKSDPKKFAMVCKNIEHKNDIEV